MSKTPGKAHDNLPGPHLVFTLTKRLVLGTYHGGVQPERFDAYLDEFTFRFNRRSLKPAIRAMRLVERALATPPIRNHIIMQRTKNAT